MGYTRQDFTSETGEQTIVKVSHNHDVTIIITGTAASDDIDLEITMDNPDKAVAVERFKLAENVISVSSPYIRTLEGPVSGVGIDIDGNVSNDISFIVITAFRGG